MGLDAGVRADGVARFGAARSQPLYSPPHLLAIHSRQISRALSLEDARRARLVECGGVAEDAGVSALCGDDLQPGLVGGAGAQQIVGELRAGLGSGALSREMQHPAAEDVRQLDQVR